MKTRKMKDSGVEWLGSVPEGWKVLRMKCCLRNISEKGHPDAEVLSLYRDLGVVPKSSRDDNHNVTGEDTTQYKFVRIGDLVINKMKAWQGSLAVSGYTGIVSPAYYVCRFNGLPIERGYAHYLMRNRRHAQEFERLSTGMRVGQWDLGIDDFMRVPLVYPPLPEQRAIAAYLDKRCAKIDAMVADAKKLIEEYKAWKASLIFEAVTGKVDVKSGKLRAKGELRDSGVEWIGQVPEGWKIQRFKFVVSKLRKGSGITKEEVFEDGDVPCVRYGEIYSKYAYSFDECYSRTRIELQAERVDVNKGDILFACTGELVEEIGKNIVYLGSSPCVAGGDIMVASHNQNSVFLNYYLNCHSSQYQKSRNKAKLKVVHVKTSDIENLIVLLPLLPEQRAIAEYLDRKCAAIDRVVAEKERLIGDLEAYKKSLIFECVTGKREVA